MILHKNDTQRMQVLHLPQWVMELTAFLHVQLRLEPLKEGGRLSPEGSSQDLWEPELLLRFRAPSDMSESRSQPGITRQQRGHRHLSVCGSHPLAVQRLQGTRLARVELGMVCACSAQQLPAGAAPASHDVWRGPGPAWGSAGKACAVGFHPWISGQRCPVRQGLESRNAVRVPAKVP